MKRRLLNVVSVISLLLALTVAVSWVTSYPPLRPDFVDLSWNLGPAGVDSESGMMFFHGGDMAGVGKRGAPGVTQWWIPGLFFLRVVRPRPSVVLGLPHAVVLTALAVLPAMMFRNHRRARQRRLRAAAGLCPSCGYDLRATAGRCPECGAVAGGTHDAAPGGGPQRRRLLDLLPRRARAILRAVTWGSTALACALFVVPLLTVFTGGLQYPYVAGSGEYSWGVSGPSYYVVWHVPFPAPALAAGEVPVAGSGRLVRGGSLPFVGWSHFYGDTYYTAGPWDPEDLSTCRRVVSYERKQLHVDLWGFAAVLALPAALVLLNGVRRYVVHGARGMKGNGCECPVCAWRARQRPERAC